MLLLLDVGGKLPILPLAKCSSSFRLLHFSNFDTPKIHLRCIEPTNLRPNFLSIL
eukprot:01792.XXX_10667_10831_1 [CDS] Oithona nana genome sequencing.